MRPRTKQHDSAHKRLRTLYLLLAVLIVLPRPVTSATITVNGQTTDAPGTCDLVEAIENANDDAATNADCAAGSGADIIDLTVDVLLVESNVGGSDNGTGTPRIDSDVTIEGDNHTVSRDPGATDKFRIFAVQGSGTLTLNEVTVSGGLISNTAMGGDSLGGGIVNQGILVLTNSTVSGNRVSAVDPSPFAYGGGIYNKGTASMTNTTVSNNVAEVDGQPTGGLHAAKGGGISNCTGACFGVYPTFNIYYSTISDNLASVVAPDTSSASAYGGGIYSPFGYMTVTNSTISTNTTYAYGPTMDAYSTAAGLSLADTDITMKNSTISSNVATLPGGTPGAGAIEYFPFYTPTVVFSETVIGNHSASYNCFGVVAGNDGGFNLADDATCGTIPSTLTGLDSVLTDNTGPTETHALMTGSSAIDAAGVCGLATDQRGVARSDGTCDSGSFEFIACAAANGDEFTVPDQVITVETTFTTCSKTTVNDTDVANGGHLILETAGEVVFNNGLDVETGGQLTVDIDPSIMVPDSN